MSHPSRRLPEGTRIGPYEIEAPLGHGGMGEVFRARHIQTGAVHALKVVLPAYLGRDSKRALARYRRESQVLARIDQHPGLVRVHAVGEEAGRPWCAMELIEGEPLTAVLAKGQLSPEQAAELISKAARAVHHAHRHGVIHRDLKPGNVILDSKGSPRVVDFGLAYDARDDRLTNTGELMGTPCFMAPEQVSRSSDDGSEPDIGPASDVYGLGALLYTCLTGTPPFSDRSGISVLLAILRETPRPPREHNASVPAHLEAICMRALQADPNQRQPSALALAEELEQWLRGELPASSASARLRSQAAQLMPRRGTRSMLVAGLSVVVVGALLATTMQSRITSPSAARDISKLRAVLSTGQRLSEAQRQTLNDLGENPPPDQVDLVLGLQLLARLLDLPPTDVSGEPLDALAAHLRQATNADQRRLVQKVLHAHQRLAQLHVLLHEAQPALSADRNVAPDLARFLASSKTTALPPVDAAAFDALYQAAGRQGGERGRLLVRHARARLRAADPDLAGILERLVQAQQFGAALSAAEWSPGLLALGKDEFLAALDSDLERAQTLDTLLAHMDGGTLVLSAIQVSVEQRGIITYSFFNQDQPDSDNTIAPHLKRALVWLSFVERQGLSPLSMSQALNVCNGVGAGRVISTGELERRLPSASRNPSRLMTLAMLLCGRKNAELSLVSEKHWEIANGWMEAARSSGVNAPWLHLSIGRHLHIQGRAAEALESLRKALELDRKRPLDERLTEIPQLMARILMESVHQPASLEKAHQAASLAMEAADVRQARRPLLASFEQLDSITPRVLGRKRDVKKVILMAATKLTTRGPPGCCSGDTSLDELLAVGHEIDNGPGRGFRGYELEMQHHEQHARWAKALESARRSMVRLLDDTSSERMATDPRRRLHIHNLKQTIERLELKAADD